MEFIFEHGFSENNVLISQTNLCFGTQKKGLDEMVLLSTQNTCLNLWVRKL